MSIKQIVILAILSLNIIIAQPVKVIETINVNQNLTKQHFYPKFSSDDSKILFSTSNYRGLYSLDLFSKEFKAISEKNGAGYYPIIQDRGEVIFFKTFRTENGLKLSSVYSYDIKTEVNQEIIKDKRRVSIPNQQSFNRLITLENSNIKQYKIRESNLDKSSDIKKAVYVEDNNLILIINETESILNPLSEGVYVWETLSKDGQYIIFSYANKGAFICNLEGEIIHNIPNAHYPRLSPDGKLLLYMVDEDDGYKYTSSDLFVYSLDEGQSYKLTNTNNKIEMYAEWSNSGNSIVYNTLAGEIYLAKLDIIN